VSLKSGSENQRFRLQEAVQAAGSSSGCRKQFRLQEAVQVDTF